MRQLCWVDKDGKVRVTMFLTKDLESQNAAIQAFKDSGEMPEGTPTVRDVVLPPEDRRHAWKIVGGRLIDDTTIPDRPQEDLIAEVDAARDVAALKAVLRKVVGGR